MAWTVGKTTMGLGGVQSSETAAEERQAQHKLSQIMRQQLMAYEQVMAKSDPHGWYGSLTKLRRMADQLEEGKWPPSSDGLNWFWSLPWGPEKWAERDCVVFWAKVDPQGGSGGSGDVVVPLVPKSGKTKELAAA